MYKQNTISELLENNRLYCMLSDKLDIRTDDYNKTLMQVCKEKEMDFTFIETLLKTYDDTCKFPIEELNECSVFELLDYLKKSHQFYLFKKLPEMELTALEVFKQYNQSHPLLSYLCVFFNSYKKQLVDHINFEEKKLFPYISSLIRIDSENAPAGQILSVLEQFSAREFISKHSNIESELQDVRKSILNYSDSGNTPLPFKIFLNQLHYFEQDLNRHAIIEDEILIPKVIELEAHLLKKAAKHSLQENSFA